MPEVKTEGVAETVEAATTPPPPTPTPDVPHSALQAGARSIKRFLWGSA
jgi:hypothetical protein